MHQADRTRRPAKERTGEGVLGIAIAKAKFDVTLLLANGKRRRKTVAKTPAGWIELQAWLKRQGGHHVHACREATGTDGDGVATWLHDHGHRVSVINPAIAAAYAKAPLARAKTDRVDADRLADDTATQPPPAWTPRPLEVRELQALGRRRDARLGMQTQEHHRRQAGALVPAVATSIDPVLASLAAEINAVRARIADHINRHPDLRRQRDVLRTLPGIGDATAAQLLGDLLHRRFTRARQAAAFAGLVPRIRESGTWRGRPALAKLGAGRLRNALYFPALTALRCNPTIRAMAARVQHAGKARMVMVGAAMRRLIHVAYGVLKSRRAYDPDLVRT
jgi:transposase